MDNNTIITEMSVPCCFNTIDEKGKHIINCTNLPTISDKDNIQPRYFCEEHMAKVESFREQMAQKYNNLEHFNEVEEATEKLKQEIINEYKEKMLNYLDSQMPLTGDNWGAKAAIMNIAGKIRNGEFD